MRVNDTVWCPSMDSYFFILSLEYKVEKESTMAHCLNLSTGEYSIENVKDLEEI